MKPAEHLTLSMKFFRLCVFCGVIHPNLLKRLSCFHLLQVVQTEYKYRMLHTAFLN